MDYEWLKFPQVAEIFDMAADLAKDDGREKITLWADGRQNIQREIQQQTGIPKAMPVPGRPGPSAASPRSPP